MVLVPTFRLPTLIHTRPANASGSTRSATPTRSGCNAADAERLGLATGDLVRVTTRIGYFVARIWAHRGDPARGGRLRHHMGRWRLHENGGSRWATGKVELDRSEDGVCRMRYASGVAPFASADPDSDADLVGGPGRAPEPHLPGPAGPVSGMHCWLQRVRLTKAAARRPVRRHRGRPPEVAADLPGVARHDPAWPQRARLAASGVPDAAGQAQAEGVQGNRMNLMLSTGRPGASTLEGAVRAATCEVVEPMLDDTLGRMDLIEEVTTSRNGEVRVTVRTLASEGDHPAGLQQAVEAAVRAVPGVRNVAVSLVPVPEDLRVSLAKGLRSRNRRPGGLGVPTRSTESPPARAGSASPPSR